MTSLDTEALRERLQEEREQLEKDLSSHGRVVDETGDWQGSSAEYSSEQSADANVVADQIEDLATNVSLVETLEQRYRNIIRALKKIQGGAYGTCEIGGEPIPAERLEANPAARTCIEHATEESALPS